MKITGDFSAVIVEVLLLALLAGCGGGGGNGTVDPTTGTVTGQVLRASDSAAVAEATVTIGGISSTTDANGRFQLAGLSTGRQSLTIVKSGYVLPATPLSVQVTLGSTNLGTIVLLPTGTGGSPPAKPW